MRILRHVLVAALALGLTAQSVSARSFAAAPPPSAAEKVEASQRARLKKVLARRRAKNLAAFQAYVARAQYPRNTLTDGELNIWIDDAGRRCAAAQMIWDSGARALVEQQAADDNFIRLANVTDGPLMDWILTSGLTHDEVVLIQRPFVGRPQRPQRPQPDPIVDEELAITRTMAAKYKGIVAELQRSRDASLDSAVDALMAHPELAAKLR